MKYWVLSPNVLNKINEYPPEDFVKIMEKEKLALIGHRDDVGSGKKFKDNIGINDVIIISHRKSYKRNNYLVGIVCSDSFEYGYEEIPLQARKLRNLIDISDIEIDWGKNCTNESNRAVPALYELKSLRIDDKKVISTIESILMNKEKNYLELLKQNKNIILTGAPGTGKTYLAKQIAYELCIGNKDASEKDKVRLEKDFEHQCGFVQFHPSYDYTDFVEGLRPVNNGDSNIGFERRDGVFKEFCKRALENYFDSRKDTKLLNLETIVKKYLIDFIEYVKNILDISSSEDFIKTIKNIIDKSNNQDLKDKTEIKLKIYKNNIDSGIEVTNFYPILGISELVAAPIISINIEDDKLVFKVATKYDYTVKKFKLDTWVKWFILFRGKGVSEYTSKLLLDTINSDKSELPDDKLKWDITYIYGFLRAFYDEYNDKITEEENKNVEVKKVELKNFVFIIDEINRGEISKIFGELFFSIDPGYRGEKGKVKTQYQNLIQDDVFDNGFYIPENVYIIGTMNDIDRSVESMDFAMRRRFAWVEVDPIDTQDMLKNLANKEIIIKRMDCLNKKIKSTEDLSKHYQIGASYFLKLENYYDESKDNIEEAFESLWKYHLKGLLAEYLRGNPEELKVLAELKKAYDLISEDTKNDSDDDTEEIE